MGDLRGAIQGDRSDRALERTSLRAELAELALDAATAEILCDAALRMLMTGLSAEAGWWVELEPGDPRRRPHLRAAMGPDAMTAVLAGEWGGPSAQVLAAGELQIFSGPFHRSTAVPAAIRRMDVPRAVALPVMLRRGAGAVVWLTCDSPEVESESARTFAQAIARSVSAAMARLDGERALTRFRQSVDLLPDGVLVMRSDGRLLDVNETAIGFYGYTREELLGLSVLDLRAGTTLPEVLWQMRRASTSGLSFETVHRHKDGTPFRCQVRSRGALLDGEHVLISVVRKLDAGDAEGPH